MRKSTLSALVLLGGLLFVFLWVGNTGIEHHRPEIEVGSAMTRQFASHLAPSSRVKLRRERGNAASIVKDREQYVLLLTATPSPELWTRDPEGKAFARDLAASAHGDRRYGPDRPIPFVEVVLERPDRSKVRLGFREDRDGRLEGFAVPPLP